jgi:hypothetical protein
VDLDRVMTRINPAIAWILRSPLHGVLDRGLLLLTVTGRRTGCRYTIPVGYQRRGDRIAVLVSKARRKRWWRNYEEPAPVTCTLRGAEVHGVACVVAPDTDEFRSTVAETLRRLPWLERQLGVDVRGGRAPTEDEWRAVARDVVLVEIALDAR